MPTKTFVPPPIPWWQSPVIRTCLTLLVPLLLKLLIATGIPAKLGIDLANTNVDHIVDWIIAVGLPVAAAYLIKKRVDAGDPAKPNPAPIVPAVLPPTVNKLMNGK